ncbi:MAG: CoB--CoM heterodisulfide reductase iron-sulfur subunit B family protein [Dehalococcoidales bacterium]|nr:CoB--CoM heterodisulfide reductase iron-sulfur subunit B family protein [Dehalococcoidales bacterium]
MKYAYYPGCSAHSTARDMHESCVAVAKELGIELQEIKGWTCCGASAAHQTDRVLAASLPAANLLLAKEMGLDMVVNCAACYNRSKNTNYEVVHSSTMYKKVTAALGQPYDGSVPVRHFVEVLLQDFGTKKLKKAVKQPLNGLKVACYYGCYLLRPPEVTNFDDPENPSIMETLIEAIGGEALEWPGKVECCGGALNLTRTDITVARSASIIEMAQAAGADCIVTACPMCQTSLDLRQRDMQKTNGKLYDIPIPYITQLIGLSLGIPAKELGINRLMVPPKAVLKALKV